MSESRAALVVLVLVALASAIGVSLGSRRAPPAQPSPSPTAATTPTPTATVDVLVRAFAQPLSSGCATSTAVWVVSDGGATIRFDGRTWSIPDPTLRSLSAVACRGGTVLAVGANGSVVTIDDELRTVRVDRVGVEDLHAIALTAENAVAVGSAGTTLRQTALDWIPFGPAVTDELFGVDVPGQGLVRPGRAQVWIVGANGAAYRLLQTGWDRVSTDTSATLRGVVQQGDAAVAAGDGGALLRFADGKWGSLASGTTADLRAITVVGVETVWAVGDRGTVIEISGERVRRLDLNTTCTLRAVFAQGPAMWIVGSDGVRGGVWRITPGGTDRWGTC